MACIDARSVKKRWQVARVKHLLPSGCILCTAGILLLGSIDDARAQRGCDPSGDVAHWRLVSEPGDSTQPIATGNFYRLVTDGGQLTPNPRVFEGLYLRPIDRRYRDVRIDVQVNSRPRGRFRTTRNVVLNERVAVFINQNTTSYVVFRSGAEGLSLGFARFDPGNELGAPRPRGIFQWEFRSPPCARTRDHRQREINNHEELALYNVQARDYLIYDKKERRLRWLSR